MAVFMDGRIVQVGTPKAVFDRPATAEVANFIGSPPMNLLNATYLDGAVKIGAPFPCHRTASWRGSAM